MQRDDWRGRDRDVRERERWDYRDDPRRDWRGPDDGPRRADDVELWGRRMDHDDWERGTYGNGDYLPGRGGDDWQRGRDRDWREAGPDWRGTNPNWGQGGRDRGWDRSRGPAPRQWDERDRGGWGQEWRLEPSNPLADDLHRGDAGDFREWPYDQGGGYYPTNSQRDYSSERQRSMDRGTSNGPTWWNDWRRGDWSQDTRWSGRQARDQHWHGRTSSRHYQRSDERIREDVYDRLADHPDLDSQEIEVTVSNGEVVLRGSVDDRWEKRLAEDVAESVSGVSYVRNELRYHQNMGATDPSRGYGYATQQPWNRQGDQSGHRIRQGMHVVGIDGEQIGQVQDMRDGSFTLSRANGQRPLYVPSRAIQSVQNDQVVLTTRSSEVENQGWESATLLPTGAME